MAECGSCSSCSLDDKANEYRNTTTGKRAVKCTLCGKEVAFEQLPVNHLVTCPECATRIEVIPLLLN